MSIEVYFTDWCLATQSSSQNIYAVRSSDIGQTSLASDKEDLLGPEVDVHMNSANRTVSLVAR